MNNLEVKRGARVVALLINGLVNGTGIGALVNLFFYASGGKTIGGMVAGFKTVNEQGKAPGLGGAIVYYFANIAQSFLFGITLLIMFFYMIATMEKRNGNFAEAWTGQRKIKD